MSFVLVLGGAGFYGHWLVTYLVENYKTENIRVLDKIPPECALLSNRCRRAFEEVDFHQCNLTLAGKQSGGGGGGVTGVLWHPMVIGLF
jgi:nucleoside-diphosphate-sugar epimerase